MKVETEIIICIAASLMKTRCDTYDDICQHLQNWCYCFYW